ncbi:hypothetical protein LVJ94_28345 [Pendulispora rubella]|uniref:Lipoprotein n=1 Tax=Pendulispora rubella TaxID=2741070 RepID=A0ABZ2KRZ9_9BACT
MKRHFVLALGVLASLAAFPACSSDDDDHGAVVETITMDCYAETTAGPALDYTVSGNTLTITANGQSSQATRSGAASGDKPIYGTWQLPTVPVSGSNAAKHKAMVSGNVRIDANRITLTSNCSSLEHTMSASSSSPVTITDTTIQLLESHKEVKHWSSRTGESTLTKTSIDTLAVQPQLDDVNVVSAGAVFPFAAY